MRKVLFFASFLLILSIVGFLNGEKAFASEEESKKQAIGWNRTGQCQECGAMWLEDESGRDKINIEYNSNKVSVYLTGQVYTSRPGVMNGYEAQAIHIQSRTNGFSITGNSLSRGRFNSGSHWTSGQSRLKATLNLSAMNISIPEGGSRVVSVSVSRCLRIVNMSDGGCGTESYSIEIARKENPKKYKLQGRTQVRNATGSGWKTGTVKIKVGETAQFKHTISTTSGDDTDDNISVKVFAGHRDLGLSGKLAGSYNVQQGLGEFFESSPNRNPSYTHFTATKVDAGKTFCQKMEFSPVTRNYDVTSDFWQSVSNGTATTTQACVYIAYDYGITTVVTPDPSCKSSCDKEEEPGTPDIPTTSRIEIPTNTNIKDTEWKLTYFVVRPNQTIPGQQAIVDNEGVRRDGGFFGGNNGDPCYSNFYNQQSRVFQSSERNDSKKIRGCEVIQSGILKTGDSGDIKTSIYGEIGKFSIPESADIGTKYCFALSVAPYKMNGDWSKEKQDTFKEWHHGKPGCILVVKKPKTQVLGGGLFSGEGVEGLISSRISNGKVRKYGSWVEFELIANRGKNEKVASNGVFGYPVGAANFSGGTGSDKVQNRLTFANNSGFGNFGKSYSATDFIRKVETSLSGVSVTSERQDISVKSPSNEQTFRPNGDAVISGIEVGSKDVIIFAPDKNITIKGDIVQSGVKSLSDISQVVIVAKNINIDSNVSRIDAWLVANGEINTCASENGNKIASSNIREGVCGKTLDINGIVAIGGTGNSFKLRRTAGSVGAGDGIGHPAETVSLNYDSYQWLHNRSVRNGAKIITTYTKELPVRL